MSVGHRHLEAMVPRQPIAAVPQEFLWYAVHTRARHENKVAAQLNEKGVVTFLPLLAATRRWTDRRKVVELPLFPGYLFVRVVLSGETRLRVLQATGVVGFVGIKGSGLPIPDKQIEDLQTLLAKKVPCAPHPFLREGQRVRIRGGCLDGVEGILVACKSDRSLVLSLDRISRSLVIQIAGYYVEPII